MDDSAHGVKATIIDLGLSRMQPSSGSAQFTILDGAIFEGEGKRASLEYTWGDLLMVALGDYQYDIYRMMRECNNDLWDTFTPFTNVLVRGHTAAFYVSADFSNTPFSRSGFTTSH